ncbi:hypothetical protein Q4F19_09420 [Sphingomonas sp. BIUV-7]|uniref:Uncharacterized protein n=1 Tax=Sphingomonas natans TaxID=3063330 RepID=A0ABT8YA67_9SPHN|nr:hypothetical protein [Sphingomonas sp. BIUV-7]MDO6414599.1 hypothetical protein [Sphingomonas sp. BIUV-7]
MFDLLARDHQELVSIAQMGEQLLSNAKKSDPDALLENRWRFERWASRHLHTLTADVLPTLLAEGPSERAESIRNLSRLTDLLVTMYVEHKARYSLHDPQPVRDSYTVSATSLLRQMQQLVAAEQQILFSRSRDSRLSMREPPISTTET